MWPNLTILKSIWVTNLLTKVVQTDRLLLVLFRKSSCHTRTTISTIWATFLSIWTTLQLQHLVTLSDAARHTRVFQPRKYLHHRFPQGLTLSPSQRSVFHLFHFLVHFRSNLPKYNFPYKNGCSIFIFKDDKVAKKVPRICVKV